MINIYGNKNNMRSKNFKIILITKKKLKYNN